MKGRLLIFATAAGLIALAMFLPRWLFRGNALSPVILSRHQSTATQPIEPAEIPSPRHLRDGSIDPAFLAIHQVHLTVDNPKDIRVLFLGDSLLYLFPIVGEKIWARDIAPLRAANFAIGGCFTQNLLWQIDNGELDALRPRVMVLLIGTNNLNDTADHVFVGIERIVAKLHAKCPDSQLLLIGLLPRDILPDSPFRRKILEINARLAGLEDRRSVFYLDIGPALLRPDGIMQPSTTPDGLHLSEQGYEIFSRNLMPPLCRMLGSPVAKSSAK